MHYFFYRKIVLSKVPCSNSQSQKYLNLICLPPGFPFQCRSRTSLVLALSLSQSITLCQRARTGLVIIPMNDRLTRDNYHGHNSFESCLPHPPECLECSCFSWWTCIKICINFLMQGWLINITFMCLANSFTVLHFPLNSAADLQKKRGLKFLLSNLNAFCSRLWRKS